MRRFIITLAEVVLELLDQSPGCTDLINDDHPCERGRYHPAHMKYGRQFWVDSVRAHPYRPVSIPYPPGYRVEPTPAPDRT